MSGSASSSALVRLYAVLRDLPWLDLQLDGGAAQALTTPPRLLGRLGTRSVAIGADATEEGPADRWVLEISDHGTTVAEILLFDSDAAVEAYLRRLSAD